jgi:hypothetical protein
MVIGYKVVERKYGKIYSLFHATQSSREIKLGVWNLADVKIVKDGTNSRYYLSGWHFFKNLEATKKFLGSINPYDRIIIKCFFRRYIRPKEHSSKGSCWLADEMKVIELL